MADTRPKRRRSAEQLAKRRERERERAKSRINIGKAFERWRELRRQKCFQSDIQVALLLLDRYEGKTTPIPGKRKRCSKAPAQSSYKGPTTLSECYGWGTDDEEEEEEEEEEEDVQKSDCYDSQDDEFVPRRCGWNDGDLHENGVDEIVYDVRDTEPSTPPPIFPSPPEIFTEDDLTGKRAFIAYEDCLQQLVSFLTLPVQSCPYRCSVGHVKCQRRPPFHVSITCRGTASIVEWTCPNGHTVWRWSSQPTVRCGIQAGDYMLATNIMLSGSNYSGMGMTSDARLACFLLDREMAESEDMLSAEQSADRGDPEKSKIRCIDRRSLIRLSISWSNIRRGVIKEDHVILANMKVLNVRVHIELPVFC